jgi:outer membrane protein OmpA-like peptidoglycan-associated protein
MNKQRLIPAFSSTSMALVMVLALVGGCASTPDSPSGAEIARSNLTALQNDSNLANRAPMEMRQAEEAVQLAEQPLPASQSRLSEHRIYMADHKIAIAREKATTRYMEEERGRIAEERDAARLAARTAEVDRARRSEEDMQRQLAELQARPTERGIVLTLGDVLFATGSAELQQGADSNLNRLVEFLKENPDRRVFIEGHTDSVGAASFNQQLSQRRADSVRYYLVSNGIASDRLSAAGLGEDNPVASNESAQGRQQNRRVEVIVENE